MTHILETHEWPFLPTVAAGYTATCGCVVMVVHKIGPTPDSLLSAQRDLHLQSLTCTANAGAHTWLKSLYEWKLSYHGNGDSLLLLMEYALFLVWQYELRRPVLAVRGPGPPELGLG